MSEWKSSLGTEEGTGETGEGSGASGEEAWGTPSSGDLSDNLPDSEHGTLSVSIVLIFVGLKRKDDSRERETGISRKLWKKIFHSP